MRSAPGCRRALTIGGTIALCLSSMVALATPVAAALGDTTLAGHMIHDPITRGKTLPAAVLNSFYTSTVNQENTSTKGTGVTTSVAVNGWRSARTTRQLMIVTLIAVSGAGKTRSFLGQVATAAAAAAGKSACTGASGSAPAVDVPVSGIPNTSYVRCQPGTSGAVVVAMSTARANIVAILVTTDKTLSRSALTAATRQQYGLLPKAGLRD